MIDNDPNRPLRIANAMLVGLPFRLAAQHYFQPQASTDENMVLFGKYLNALGGLHGQAMDPRRSTPAYRDNTEPDVLALMPVAAHQEMETLPVALEQYANQVDSPRSRILLFLNWPPDPQHDEAVSETAYQLRSFQARNPEVPVAFFGMPFAPEASIGELRKLLWDTALYPIRMSERTDDILMLNHDADIRYFDPLHFRTMRQAFEANALEPAMAVYPYGRHQLSGGKLPNMDAVLAWYDFECAYFGWPYEAGSGVSARAHMAVSGFGAQGLREFHDMVSSFYPEGVRYGEIHVDEAEVCFSSRRMYHKLLDGYGPRDFWDEKTAISGSDAYRTLDIASLRDISAVEGGHFIKQIIAGEGRNFFGAMAWDRISSGDTDAAAFDHARRVLHAGRILLGGGDGIRLEDDALRSAYRSHTAHLITQGTI